MISPAPTSCPPNRFTPSRWAFESRPFRLDEAPFLCAISALLPRAGCCLPGADLGDLHLRVLLPVTKPAPVAGLVLVMNHVDLGPAGRTDDLRRDLVPAEHGRVADDLVVVDDEHGGKRQAGPDLAGELVNGQDVVNGRLLLPAAAAHDRVHRELSLPYAGPPRDSRNQLDIEASGLLPCARRIRRRTAAGSTLCAEHKGYQTRSPLRSPRPVPAWSPDRLPGCRSRRSPRHRRGRPLRRAPRPAPVPARQAPGAADGTRD